MRHPELSLTARAYLASRYEHLQAITRQWVEKTSVQIEVTREALATLHKEIRAVMNAAACLGAGAPAR